MIMRLVLPNTQNYGYCRVLLIWKQAQRLTHVGSHHCTWHSCGVTHTAWPWNPRLQSP